MINAIQPFHLITIALGSWFNRQQQAVIDYLIEENRILKEQPKGSVFELPTNSGYDWL